MITASVQGYEEQHDDVNSIHKNADWGIFTDTVFFIVPVDSADGL